MPAVDYDKRANTIEQRVFNRSVISAKNKSQLRIFLEGYTVCVSTRCIFLDRIERVLVATKDLSNDMHNARVINSIFNQLKTNCKPSSYNTFVSVAKRYVRWLNNGTLPEGFADIKPFPRHLAKRDLTPQDMITWENGLQLISATYSVQFKAIIPTQLDGGFRPSEFSDINYGDVTVYEHFIVIYVRDGKTGPRNVILWRAVPYLLKWLEAHPTKKKDDPLWVQEHQHGGKILRYRYQAITKVITQLAREVGLNKPTDHYVFRHSAVVICKLDGVPDAEGAKKFGHSLKEYTDTYGRFSIDFKLQQFEVAYGIKQKTKVAELPRTCLRCNYINTPDAEICHKCSALLTMGRVMQEYNERRSIIEDNLNLKEDTATMKKQLDKINAFFNKLLHTNPDIIKVVAQANAQNNSHSTPNGSCQCSCHAQIEIKEVQAEN